MRVEEDIINIRLTITSLQLLHDLSRICTVNLDNVSSLRGGGNQRAVWVHGDGADLAVVRWYHEVNGFVDNCAKGRKRMGLAVQK